MNNLSNLRPPSNRSPLRAFLSACILFACLFAPSVSRAQPQFVRVGSAFQGSGNCFELTPDATSQNGAIWYITKINLTANAHIEGILNFGAKDANGADGMAFVMQPVSNGIGGIGGNLGFGGISPSYAVEFDNFSNPENSDPVADHIAVVKNGDVNHGNGGSTLFGPVALPNVENGNAHVFIIDWNAATKKLQVTLDGILRVDYTNDVVANIFGGVDKVFWGFTASTGGFSNVQQMCFTNYTFTQDPSLTWTNNNGNNKWYTGGNWTGGQSPSSNDLVVFNAATGTDVDIDGDVDIESIDVEDDYIGTVKLNDKTMEVKNGFTVKKPASFLAGFGKVKFKKGQKVDTKAGLFDVEMEAGSSSTYVFLEDLTVFRDLTVKHNITLNSPNGSKSIKVNGNVNIDAQISHLSNSAIKMKGMLDQRLRASGFAEIEIDKATGRVKLDANTSVQKLKIVRGILELEQKTMQIVALTNIPADAKLTGKGKIKTPKLTIKPNGKLAPGNSPGLMIVEGDFALEPGADLEFETTPTAYDTLRVLGTVELGGNLVVQATGAVPGNLTVIDNDDTDAVTGTFAGLPQGSTVDVNGATYFISYTGGTGNDVVLSPCPGGSFLYVKSGATGANDGTSWADAFTDLQSALGSSCPGITQIWVAAGTYKPTGGTDRDISFTMKNGVEILGGFPSTGDPAIADRDWAANPTILSGEIGGAGNGDNSYQVILNNNPGMNNSAVLDGFTISDAYNNVSFSGGMTNSGCSPTVKNCTFFNNSANQGGGMANFQSSPTVTNCQFIGNTGDGGGIINIYTSNPAVTNCTFSGNSGAMNSIISSNPTVKNCILWGNTSQIGGAATVSYSIVQGGFAGTGNLDADPLFVSQPPIGLGNTGDLHLQQCSPAREAGTASGAPATDFDGDARPQGSGIDMGFDESTAPPCCPTGSIFYVKAGATGANSGLSWADAFTDLQSALNSTCPGITQIWVAAGTYKPTSGTDRNASFSMKNGVEILGGFPNTGDPTLADRNWTANPTILSGEIGGAGNGDNSFHVLKNISLNSTAVLDGFTVTGGNANGSGTNYFGGAMFNEYSSPTVSNCVFTGNSANNGGGMYNFPSSSPTVNNCVFSGNTASITGGGMYCSSQSSPVLTNCAFSGNSAVEAGGMYSGDHSSPNLTNCTFSGNTGDGGGGMCSMDFSSPSLTNCVFSGNSANAGAGMVNLFSSSPFLTNCTFSGNTGNGGGAVSVIYNVSSSSPTLKNCILWGNSGGIANFNNSNPSVTYSIVQGGYGGTGNLNADPLFISATDLHLQQCSPAREAGTASGAPATDFDGDARPQGSGIDMGFDESTAPPCCPTGSIFYVKANATGGNTGFSWADAFTDLQSALNNTCPGIAQIWVAAGTYKPTVGINRSVSFVMKNDVEILGGFPNTGDPGLGDRDWASNPTILSGDIGGAGNGDNTLNIIHNNGLNSTAALDGFTITGANGNVPGFDIGGGMRNVLSSPTVANCTFSGNSAHSGGGIGNIQSSSPTVTNCAFLGNSATSDGGGMYNIISCSPTVTNCTFSGNSAISGGGGMKSENSSNPNVKNAIFWGNTSQIGGGATVTYSIVQGGYGGTGNLNVDPLFVSATDLRLQNCSPAIDAGLDAANPTTTDLGGLPRKFEAIPGGQMIDMGAHENQSGDQTAPTALCQNITVPLIGASASITASQIDDGSSDNCSFTLSATPTSFSCANVGANTVVLTVTDASSNTATCLSTVTISDNTLPTAICKNITVPLAGPSASITASQIDDGSSDNCSFALSATPTSFSCANVGANTVTLTVTDASSNTATCLSTVTIVDNTPPTAVCKNITVPLAGASASITAAQIDNGSSDNCSFSLSATPTSFSCANVGANTVTLTVTDASSNTATCLSTVTIVDNTLPTAICKNITVPLAGASATITAAQIDNGSSDNCSFTLSATPTSFSCANVGANTVTLTVTDASSNTATCLSTVTVSDNTLPTAICKNITVPLVGASATITAAQIDNGSSDNCSFTLSATPTSFGCANVGANTVVLTVTDASSNTATCLSTVTIVDNQFPTITCPGPITVNNAPGLCSAPVSYVVTASDNCAYTKTQVSGLASGAQFPVGTTTNIWKVTDASGHTATCSFSVTVLKIGDPGLLYAYTVIGKDDVKMKTNTVQSGGVGVVNAGKKAKLEQTTLVTATNTFVKAPVLDLHSGSVVTTYYPGQVSSGLLPAFLPNNSPGSNDVNIPDNSSPVTLNLASYGKITVGKNVVATFSGNASVLAKEVKLKEGSTLLFNQNTHVLIDKKLDGDKDVTINNGGKTVWLYVEDDVKIDEGSDVTANIYTDKNLKVEKAKSDNTTQMTGLFIADKVDSKEYVYWNWSPSYCPGAPPSYLVANLNALTFYAERKGLTTKLQWFTRTGQTNDHFVVERSANEQDWHPIGKVDGEGPADELIVFNELDLDPLSGDNFYRLRLVSKDGSERLSTVQKVVFPDGNLSVYPNPNGGDVLFTAMAEFAGQAAHVEISNAVGNVLETRDFAELPGAEIGWDISQLASGTYFISVKIPGKRAIVKRFVVQRL